MTSSLSARLFAVFAVAAALLAPVAFADDEKKDAGKGYDTPMPLNPFANSKEGDWYVMVARIKPAEGTELPPSMAAPKVVEWRVTKVDGDKVTVRETESSKSAPKEHTFSKAEAPTIGQYLDMKKKGKLEVEKAEDAECKLGDTKVACKKIAFTEKNGPMTASGKVFVSETVKGGGMVRMEAEFAGPRGTITMVGECVGHGNGDKAEWGKTFAETQEATKAEKPAKADKPEKAEPAKPEKSRK
ncbi:MAG: hypothetical protein ACAI25_12145 [Planctomycetota bacterium]